MMRTRGEMMTISVLKAAGGKAALDAKYQQHKRSVTFIRIKRKQLLEDYAESWVAVQGNRVVAHGKEYHSVAEEIRSQGIPMEDTVIQFLTNQLFITLF